MGTTLLRPLSAAFAAAILGASLGCTPREGYEPTTRDAGEPRDEPIGMEADTARINHVQVTLTDGEIQLQDSIPAGKAEFQFRNAGSSEQTVRIEGQNVEESIDGLGPGETDTVSVDLEPGIYRVFNPDAEDRGMAVQFVVKQADSVAAPGPAPEPPSEY